MTNPVESVRPQRAASPFGLGRDVTARWRGGGIILSPARSRNVWDAGDLVRLRRAVRRLVRSGHRRIGLDLSNALRLPPGFAGQLWAWSDAGAEIRIVRAEPEIKQMLWFRMSTVDEGRDGWRVVAPPAPGPRSPDRTSSTPAIRLAARAESTEENRGAEGLWPRVRKTAGELEL